jgi:16S rRNA processing protein RimM
MATKATPISMLGYTLFNGTEELGEIEEVIEQPMQVLAKLTIQNKEVLIPLHSETLKKVDKKHKRVYVELPEGLLDIYLGG